MAEKKRQFTQKDVNDQKAFLTDWYSKRNTFGMDVDRAGILNQINGIGSFVPIVETSMIDDDPGVDGKYYPGENKIELLYDVNPFVLKHEMNHASRRKSHLSNISDAIIYRQNLKPVAQYADEFRGSQLKYGIMNDEPVNSYAYFADPKEGQTRLMKLRKEAGFKPDQTVTEKDLDNYFKKYKNEHSEINELLEVTKDRKSLLNMLNLMSSTGNNKNKLVAKNGGVVNKPSDRVLLGTSNAKHILQANKKLNFVNRALNNKTAPTLDNGDGSHSTHSMTWATGEDGQAYVYPTVIQRKRSKTLERLDPKDAYKYAMETGEYILMSEDMVDDFSKWGYKAGAGYPYNTYENSLPQYETGGIVNTPNVEAEGGEVLQLPDGNTLTLNGPSHKQGGIDLDVPNGSIIFSDSLGIKDEDGKFRTLADRKKAREKELTKLEKLLSIRKDPLLKNSMKRMKERIEREEAADLQFQDAFNRSNGTGEYAEGQVKAETGASIGGVQGALGAVSSLAGVYGSLKNASELGDWYANRPKMPNFYEDFGLKSMEKYNELKTNLETQKTSAMNMIEKKLQAQQQNTAAKIDAAGGTLNLKRALRASSKLSSDSAYADAYTALESDYASKLADIGGQEADMLAKRDQAVAMGAAAAFGDQQDAYDTFHSAKTQNTQDTLSSVMNVGQSIADGIKYNDNKSMMEEYLKIYGSKNTVGDTSTSFIPPGIAINTKSFSFA